MFARDEAESHVNKIYLHNTVEVSYEDFMSRVESIIEDQKSEIVKLSEVMKTIEAMEKNVKSLAGVSCAAAMAGIQNEMHDYMLKLEIAPLVKDKTIFFMKGAKPIMLYVGEDLKMKNDQINKELMLSYQ